MSRRSLATLIGFGLAVVLTLSVTFVRVPYVTVSPGPTLNVLGDFEDEPIVEVKGAKTYPTTGELRLVAVLVSRPDRRVNLLEAMEGWLRPSVDVLPYDVEYPEQVSDEESRSESSGQMVTAQSQAIAAALSALDYEIAPYVQVTSIPPGSPSKGQLKSRDRFVEVNGTRIEGFETLATAMGGVVAGDVVTGVVQRGNERRDFEVTTTADPADPKRALLGVNIGFGYETPFEVTVDIGDRIGGPSAGLTFALSIYDTLTPGGLLDGQSVAGTGTIDGRGSVGPIGGIAQKIVAARDAGATLFLVPPANCADALRAAVDPEEIRLVRADSLTSAVDSLKTYAADQDADLPRCQAA